MNAPIRLDDRISTVLARDERLLDVLASASPALAKLRNPILRKTMSKLATVEHAARVAGLDANDLLARLNGALEGKPIQAPSSPRAASIAAEAPPPAILGIPADRVVDLDVRDDLRAGREPFQRILQESLRVRAGEVLRLRAIFEPAPLYAVLGRQGFAHFTERLADDDWRVWFWRDPSAASQASASQPSPSAAEVEEAEGLVVIDVRGLEPPEPMVRTLEALERLPRGSTLLQINERVPQFLIPQLAARGFVHEVREQSADLVRIFIRHANT